MGCNNSNLIKPLLPITKLSYSIPSAPKIDPSPSPSNNIPRINLPPTYQKIY